MQGLRTPDELRIFREMKRVVQQEGIDLFINQNNTKVSHNLSSKCKPDNKLSIWGQDNKVFLKNKNEKIIGWNLQESVFKNLGALSDFKIFARKYMPRGGNYYLGNKENGEKWLLINSMEVANEQSFKAFGDKPMLKHLTNLFEIRDKNIFVINEFRSDLDFFVRPIGYPFILVNDYSESLKNLEKMKKKFPDSKMYNTIRKEVAKQLDFENSCGAILSTDDYCETLKGFGFKPIKIAARYSPNINFINALALKNQNNEISYITNATRCGVPELEYLEKLFEQDLRKRIKNIRNIHFISGAYKEQLNKDEDKLYEIKQLHGFDTDNAIMNILANRGGGIHCMTAEIPI